MTDEILSKLSKLKIKISELEKKNINEAQTKKWLIEPFFELLGWDFSNPNEVIPEDDDNAGKRSDYNFCVKGSSKF